MNQRTVILADAFTRSGLAVARSLGGHGVEVIAVSRKIPNLVSRSRFVAERLVGPDPVSDKAMYASFIAEAAGRVATPLVIPVTDAAVSALNEHRGELPLATRLALPDAGAVQAVLDKRRNLEVARAAGIPCPADYGKLTRAKLKVTAAKLEFPVVLKNADPDKKGLQRPLPFRVRIAQDLQQLQALLDVVEQSDSDVLFQQYIKGRRLNICVFALDGEVRAMHGYVSLRSTLHEGIAREVIALRDDVKKHVRNLMSELRWSGVALVQFFVDAETNEPYYLETNGRFWASIQGSIHAGWNFPVWLYEYYVNGKLPHVQPIQLGSRTVYRKVDLRQLLGFWLGGPPPSIDTRGRLHAAWQVLRDFAPSVHSDLWSWRDPYPPLCDFFELFKPSTNRD